MNKLMSATAIALLGMMTQAEAAGFVCTAAAVVNTSETEQAVRIWPIWRLWRITFECGAVRHACKRWLPEGWHPVGHGHCALCGAVRKIISVEGSASRG